MNLRLVPTPPQGEARDTYVDLCSQLAELMNFAPPEEREILLDEEEAADLGQYPEIINRLGFDLQATWKKDLKWEGGKLVVCD